ncbi:hypothetical protein OUZ56_023892 [Daphnia magna]|uniref:Uncharacterized protein n=1 Tax=Daphnia magna TaxID=35525 RepID=A0ABR0AZQ9_9CRUS|nr:hypothetical protein OUZ56_023892 [Daphnia magna]
MKLPTVHEVGDPSVTADLSAIGASRARPRLAEITDLIYPKNGRSVAIGSGPPETDRFRCGSSVRSGMATLTGSSGKMRVLQDVTSFSLTLMNS